MRRLDQRQGFLVSAVIHLTLLMILIWHPPVPRRDAQIDPATLERKDLVFLPPASVLKQLVPLARRSREAPRAPAPVPTPPPQGKDRVSIGPPTDVRLKGPVILRREDDLTKAPKGRPDAAPSQPAPTPLPAAPAAPAAAARTAQNETPGREGLRLPPGIGAPRQSGDEGSRQRQTSLGRSLPGAVDSIARRLEHEAQLGIPTGTGGKSIAGLAFDPQGADFSVWANHFKGELYRNWIVPQAALFGFAGGHVDFQVVIERDGTISSLEILKSSGTASLDRAARNAITSSRFMELPSDYRPPRLAIQLTFEYGTRPEGS